MALSEFEIRRCQKEVEKFIAQRKTPRAVRSRVALSYRIKNQSVELFEIRPQWNNPKNKIEHPLAKATYVKTKKIWKIYWKRKDLRWHGYDPVPTAKYIEDFLEVVNEDAYACFFG